MSPSHQATKVTQKSPEEKTEKEKERGEFPQLSLRGALVLQVGLQPSNLRKRAATGAAAPPPKKLLLDKASLTSCNSSNFLSSLLADLAKAKEEIIAQKKAQGKDFRLPCNKKRQRRRISLLDQATSTFNSTSNSNSMPSRKKSATISPVLDLLWEESWIPPPRFSRRQDQNQVHLVPPEPEPQDDVDDSQKDLPATVSTSFETMTTTKTTEEEGPNHQIQEESSSSSFGWFVDTDKDDCEKTSSALTESRYSFSSSANLAFSAYTAPKASNHEAENVEWAKAADTVDDVLADFF